MASSDSHRQIVVPEISATIPRPTTSAPMSGTCKPRQRHAQPRRQFAGQGLDGDDHLRGERPGVDRLGAFLEPGQAVLEEPFAPLRHDLPAGVEPGGDLVVVETVGGHEHDLGPHHISIRQRISAGSCLQFAALLGGQLHHVRALPRHRLPSSRGALTLPEAPIRDCSYVLVFMVGCTKPMSRAARTAVNDPRSRRQQRRGLASVHAAAATKRARKPTHVKHHGDRRRVRQHRTRRRTQRACRQPPRQRRRVGRQRRSDLDNPATPRARAHPADRQQERLRRIAGRRRASGWYIRAERTPCARDRTRGIVAAGLGATAPTSVDLLERRRQMSGAKVRQPLL